MLALYRMPGLRCCFAECIAMCAWRACLHTVLRCSAAACLLVPIFADHVGGLHVAMLFEWCVQAFPSGHVGPLATAGNKRWELREGTAKKRREVAWAEQFPRGGGLSGACYVLYMCLRAFAGEPRVSVTRIWPWRVSGAHM